MLPTGAADPDTGAVNLDTTAEHRALATVFRARRKALGMSQTDVAARGGGEIRSVQRVELARHTPLFSRLLLLCRAVDWTLSDLAAALEAEMVRQAGGTGAAR